MRKQKNTVNTDILLSGIIVPVDWDTWGNPVAFVLSTFDEMEYLIGRGPEDMSIRKYIGEKVLVDGILSKEANKTVIRIREIRSI